MALLPGDDAPYVFESELTCRALGVPLLDHLAGRFAYQSREVWEARVRAGDVTLDGRKLTDPGEPLPASGMLSYLHGTYREPEVPTDWRVLYSAATWMAVEKPAGMPVHSTSRIFRQSLSWQVRRLFGKEWSPVHRLDRDTSGLVLFGRGREALSRLGRWFSERTVSKRYLALVHGNPREDFLVDAPLGSAEDPRIQMKQAVRSDGKECQTSFRVLGPDDRGRGVWLEAAPRQGRTHQIRAHLEFAGFSIVGDLLYDGRGGEAFLARASGASSGDIARMAGTERMWLHAWGLDIPGALDDMPARLVCPLPGAPSLD
jgi:23S rRNA pseudouridine1911/1915/1917 synthase